MKISIPHSQPTLTLIDHRALKEIFQNQLIAQGQQVRLFEKALAGHQALKEAVATSSGTAALHLALLALNVQKGDQVIIPSYVCTALLNAVHCVRATPVLVDVSPEDGNISLAATQKALSPRTKAIIIPHMFGTPADIKGFTRLGVPLIEDCAQALGAAYENKPVGSYGVLSIYSFYATKVITTGEGGMVASNNRQLINKIRDLREYDNKKDYRLRFNYKMTDLQAALGIRQLESIDQFLSKRRLIAKQYERAFEDLPLKRPQEEGMKKNIFYRYIIKTSKKKALLTFLHAKGIRASSPVYKPLHFYLKKKNYPVTDQLMRQDVSLPIYPRLTGQNIGYIQNQVKKFFQR